MRRFLSVTMPFVSGLTLLILGLTTTSWADDGCYWGCVTRAPEIDPSSGMSALALLAGALLVIRARRNT
jgi:hypothetical protein